MGKGARPSTGKTHHQKSRRGKRVRRSSKKIQAIPANTNPIPSKNWGRLVLWGMTFTTVISLSAVLGASLALFPIFKVPDLSDNQPISIKDIFEKGLNYGIARPVNVLVMGIDLNLEAEPGDKAAIFKSRSDTMLLVRLDPSNHKVNLLSIPRDTRVEIPDVGLDKINAANWYGGPKLASTVVSKTLNDVPIDRYVRISTGAFRELIDVVGGVDVFVPQRMLYEDKTQGLSIDLEPGLQHLDGNQAEGFSRFRNDQAGDIGRAQRQQILIKALQKRLANPLMLIKVPQIFTVLQKYIDSDLSLDEMLALVQFGLQLKSDQLQMTLLPGRFSSPEEFEASYWIMDFAAMDRVMATYFDIAPPSGYEDTVLDDPAQDFLLKVDIQNASEDPDAPYYMADYLYSLGYSNVRVADDWTEPLTKTIVIPQWGNANAGRRLQDRLEKSRLSVEATGTLQSDLTIRLGKDWLKTKEAKDFMPGGQDENPNGEESEQFPGTSDGIQGPGESNGIQPYDPNF